VEEKRSGLGLARPVKLNVKRAASVNEKKAGGMHGLGFSFHFTLFYFIARILLETSVLDV
jgi:hypothetical protein